MSNPKLSRRFSDLDRRLTQLNKNLIGSFKNRNVSDLTKRQMDLARDLEYYVMQNSRHTLKIEQLKC